jgi:hypothetical protein
MTMSEDIPMFSSVEDVLRSNDVSVRDKQRIVACLKKNIEYKKLKEYYDTLDDEKKQSFYESIFSIWEQSQSFMQNTTITWKNDKTLVYKVNADKSIIHIKTVNTSNYHTIRV